MVGADRRRSGRCPMIAPNRCAPRVTSLSVGQNERTIGTMGRHSERGSFRLILDLQVVPGESIAGFTVVGEKPGRVHGVLCWPVRCPHDHLTSVSHAALSAATPICAQCVAVAQKKATGHGESTEQYQSWAREHRVPKGKTGGNHASSNLQNSSK